MKFRIAVLIAIFAAPLTAGLITISRASDLDKPIPAPANDPLNNAASEVAVLAGGCFWGQQGVFEHVKGVTKVVSGYSGGEARTATYDQVTTETTGHAE
ncbi:MAG: peptide-methionine (S)-S-oxide reductase, partial [Alphaproteobacteria bacterium]|nr:peptide-methionine (S)-S-oxide reductase [Alphaproteobacteria bacterium]